MDQNLNDVHGEKHPSHLRFRIITALIGVAGGTALIVGIVFWYFKVVDPIWRKHPNSQTQSDHGTAAGVGDDREITTDVQVFDIVPLSEREVKLITGRAKNVEVPKDSGLSATAEGKTVKISAAKDAQQGSHKVIIKDGKGRATTVTVNVNPTAPR